MKRIFISCSLLLAAISASAQTDSTNVDSFYVLSPVEVRALRVNNKAPFAVSNISGKALAKQNLGQNLPYLLQQTPSVVASSDDGLGVGYSSLRIRGTDITRINVTLNGIPVNDPESQGAFFVNIPDLASSSSSIQIQRGVGSSTNGAGAFGASINIFNLEQSREASAFASNAYGSFNTWKHTVGASTGLLKGGFQFDVRASKLNSDGYINRAISDLKSLHLISGWTSSNEKTNIKFNLMTGKERTGQAWNGIETYFTDNTAASYNYTQQLNEAGRRSNELGKMANGDYYNDQTDNYQQDYYQLFFNHSFNSKWSVNTGVFMTRGRGYYNEYKKQDKFSTYFLPTSITIGDSIITRTNLTRQLWLDNYYYGTVFSTTYNTANTNVILGGGYTQYDGDHYGFVKWAELGIPLDYKWYDLPASKKDFNIYAKLQQQFVKGLYGFVDLQYRHVAHQMHGFRKNPDIEASGNFNFFNPKLGASYLINHLNNRMSKVFASFAIANKEPNRNDFETSSNSNQVKAEHLKDYELGYDFNSPDFQAGVTGYYMDYKNQLITTGQINDVGASVRTNAPKSYKTGIELVATYKLQNWLQLSANATFSRNKIKSITQYMETEVEGVYTNTNISFAPNTISGATLTFIPFANKTGWQQLYIDVLNKSVSRQYLDNSSNKLRSINPYNLTDLRFRYDMPLKHIKNIGINIMLNNIFDKKYENNGFSYAYMDGADKYTVNGYFPQAGFNFNAGITLSF